MHTCNISYKLHTAFFFLLMFFASAVQGGEFLPAARRVALKGNLLYGATGTLNLGAEFPLTDNLSLDIPVNWNPWQFSDNRKWKHFLVQPELRLWKEETSAGHFLGFHAHYAYYNTGNLPAPFSENMRRSRYQGWLAGAGVSYGHRWDFNHRWGLEATLGVGYAYLDHDKYPCRKCGEKLKSDTRHYFGPTKAGISLVYAIGGKHKPAPQPAAVYVPPVVVEPPAVEPESVPKVITETVVVEETISTGDKLARSYPYIASYETLKESGSLSALTLTTEERRHAITVHFAQGSHAISDDYGDNRQALTDLMASIRILENSNDSEVAAVVVAGFSSPEGDPQANGRLAARRAETVKTYILGRSGVRPDQVQVHAGGIDWQGLRMLVEASDMSWRASVLDIIDNVPVWDSRRQRGRHGELMRLDGGVPYRYMFSEFFPEMRNAAYIKVYYRNK